MGLPQERVVGEGKRPEPSFGAGRPPLGPRGWGVLGALRAVGVARELAGERGAKVGRVPARPARPRVEVISAAP